MERWHRPFMEANFCLPELAGIRNQTSVMNYRRGFNGLLKHKQSNIIEHTMEHKAPGQLHLQEGRRLQPCYSFGLWEL